MLCELAFNACRVAPVGCVLLVAAVVGGVVAAICFAWLTNVLCVRLDALVLGGWGLCFWVLWFLDVILV